MPNWSNFTIRVTGPRGDRDELAELLERGVEPPPAGADHDEAVLRFEAGSWGELQDGQQRVWVRPLISSDGGPARYIARGEESLGFSGTTAWCPPLEWMRAASARYPRLRFTSASTTENEWYEEWVAEAGEIDQREERLFDVPTDQVVRWVRDGRVVIDGRAGMPVPDRLVNPDLAGCGEGYRRLIVERLALLEQYHLTSRFRPRGGGLDALADRLDENDRLTDELVARTGVEDLDPADDAERQKIVEERLACYRRVRAAQRTRPDAERTPVQGDGDIPRATPGPVTRVGG